MNNLHLRSVVQPLVHVGHATPRRSRPAPIGSIYLPSRLVLGGAACMLGGAVLATSILASPHLLLGALLVGTILVALGTALVLRARIDGCRACSRTLVHASTVFPLGRLEELRHAVTWLARDNVESLMALRSAPLARAPRMSALLVGFCPSCRTVARVASATTERTSDEGHAVEHVSAPLVLQGAGVSRVLAMIHARNRAMEEVQRARAKG